MFECHYAYHNHYKNPYQKQTIYDKTIAGLDTHEFEQAFRTISQWPHYQPTPLVNLQDIAHKLNIGKLFYKDESQRFHLKSFKALGGSYAVHHVAQHYKARHGSLENFVVCTATDGNHGAFCSLGSPITGD